MAKRGIVSIDTTITRIWRKDKEIKGDFEVAILGEEDGVYHIKFNDKELERARNVLKYVLKNNCRIIEE
jgi:hypothetical protein